MARYPRQAGESGNRCPRVFTVVFILFCFILLLIACKKKFTTLQRCRLLFWLGDPESYSATTKGRKLVLVPISSSTNTGLMKRQSFTLNTKNTPAYPSIPSCSPKCHSPEPRPPAIEAPDPIPPKPPEARHLPRIRLPWPALPWSTSATSSITPQSRPVLASLWRRGRFVWHGSLRIQSRNPFEAPSPPYAGLRPCERAGSRISFTSRSEAECVLPVLSFRRGGNQSARRLTCANADWLNHDPFDEGDMKMSPKGLEGSARADWLKRLTRRSLARKLATRLSKTSA